MTLTISHLLNGFLFSSVFAAILSIVLALTPRRQFNAATRYMIWWLGLFCVLLLPLGYAARPSHPVAPLPPAAQPVSTRIPIAPALDPPAAPIVIPLPAAHLNWTRVLPLVWAAISAILLLRLMVASFLLTRIAGRAIPAAPDLRARLATWTRGLYPRLPAGAVPTLSLRISAEISTPIATGPFNRAILLPASLLHQITSADLDRIGLHETAHLARRDDYALFLERIIQSIFFFHPIVWWIARRIDLEREIACDDFVVAAMGGAASYATCLTRIVEFGLAAPMRWPAVHAAESGSHLFRRIDALLDKTRRVGARFMRARFASTAVALLAIAIAALNTPAVIALVPETARAQLKRILHTPVLALPQAAATVPASSASETTVNPEGTIVEDSTGAPIPSVVLRFHKAGMRELAADLETDRQGRFIAEGLPPGDYTVDVAKPTYGSVNLRLHVPSAKLNLRLVRYGIIDGKVTNASGRPLPSRVTGAYGPTAGGTRVNVLSKDSSGSLRSYREVSLDDEGGFRFFDLPPGEYAVGIWYWNLPEGSGMQMYPDSAHPRFFTVSGGEEYTGIDFVVMPQPSVRVTGKVEIPPNLSGPVQLALAIPEQPVLPLSQVLAQSNGTFTFEHIPPGNYDLLASGPATGYGAYESILSDTIPPVFGRTRIQVGSQNVDNITLSLAPARSVRAIVRIDSPDADPSKPTDGCPSAVTLRVIPLEPWALMMQTNKRVNFTTPETISGLMPGKVRLAASDLGDKCFQVGDGVVELSTDPPDPFVIKIAPAGAITGTVQPQMRVGFSLQGADATSFAYTAGDGHFEQTHLQPGRYRVSATGFRPAEVEVKGGKTTEVQLVPTTGEAK